MPFASLSIVPTNIRIPSIKPQMLDTKYKIPNDKHVINIGKALETKIHSSLLSILKDDFESYKKFFKEFGNQIKFVCSKSSEKNSK